MRDNRAIWVLYEDRFSYLLRKRETYQGVSYSSEDYMTHADKWEPECLDDDNNFASCE